MMSRLYSACPHGVEAVPVTVEVDVRDNNQRSTISIVGMPDLATRESKDRLIPAITNSGYALFNNEVVINLGPADLRKEGAAFDLPMAIGILISKGIIPKDQVTDHLLLGELALDGTLRPVRSVLAAAECARAHGFSNIVVPEENGEEAALIEGLTVFKAGSLAQLVRHLRGREIMLPLAPEMGRLEGLPTTNPFDFRDVKGQAHARRAVEIAAAGSHNLLMFGPPGSGKSMIGKRVTGIMPPMTHEEIIEVTRIYSASGKLKPGQRAMTKRPFRSPHHTCSSISLIGGGTIPRPGEVTQSHLGVLFLDEFTEFPRHVLEVLRQPLEDKQVTISRAVQSITFPASFLMVAAMNPCPCGWRGDLRRSCTCMPSTISRYRSKISGPIMDRIDLHVEVASLSLATIRKLPPAESSETMRQRVMRARTTQTQRFGSALVTNGNMSSEQMRKSCQLEEPLADMVEQQLERRGCSKRVHDKVIRVARTIADLSGHQHIQKDHLLESLSFRQFDHDTRSRVPANPEEVSHESIASNF